ncbi:homeodomain-like protein [Tanacetum coccineum]
MENANPPPTNDPHVLPTAIREKVVQELNELQEISTYIDSRLENIDQLLNGFTQQPNEIDVDGFKPNNESVDTPLVSPFLDSDDDSDDSEVLNELEEYDNAGQLCRQRAVNSFDEDDLALQCMIGFRKFVAYFDPFLPMNIITRKAYNTIMVKGLESTGKNLVSIVRDVYVFVESFTYITDFVVLEDKGEFIVRNMAEVVMGKPFRKITKLEYDCAKGLMASLGRLRSDAVTRILTPSLAYLDAIATTSPGSTDADLAGCLSTRRSTSRYCVFLGNNLLSRSSKRQHTLSHSSAEAEYCYVANVIVETTWLHNLLCELHTSLQTATLVYYDNVSAL